MPRHRRIVFENAFYHIFSRGNDKKNIYRMEADYNKFIFILEKLKHSYDHLLYGYCLMPNHFHLLIETRKIPISKIMSSLLTSYTMYFNKKYKRSGHLFQDRFRSLICEKENYFLTIARYIHLNPVKAGLVEKPEEYLWSSHNEYIGSESRLVDKELLFDLINKKDYLSFIEDGRRKVEQISYPDVIRNQFVGTPLFITRMVRKLSHRGKSD